MRRCISITLTHRPTTRRLLLIYLARINELADRPEWYHLLTNSCTINIIRYANAAGREGRFDFRHLLNGLIDSYLYHSGRVDTTLPYEELDILALSIGSPSYCYMRPPNCLSSPIMQFIAASSSVDIR